MMPGGGARIVSMIVLAGILGLLASCSSPASPSTEAPPPPAAIDRATPVSVAAAVPTATNTPTALPAPTDPPALVEEPTSIPTATATPSPTSAPTPTATPASPDSDSQTGETVTNDDSATPAPEATADGFGSCGSELAYFQYSPVALDDFMGLVPLGNLGPPGHTFPTDHIYFHINRIDKSQWELGTVSVPVVSPGDVWITEFAVTEVLSNDPPLTDYGLTFTPCNEIHAFFIHLSSLTDELLAAVGTDFDLCHEYSIDGAGDFRYCEKKGVRIKLSAGEVIGTAGGNQYANALDLGVYDLRGPANAFANPDRWSDRTLYITCPLDYFVPEVQEALVQRLGAHDASAPRTVEPICGEVEQDEPGTAQGVWMAAGTEFTYPEDPHLSLVRDNLDPSKSVFSVGNGAGSSGLQWGLYYFRPLDSGLVNRAFRDVTPGEVYCYENLLLRFDEPSGVNIILELTSGTSLRIERINGACGAGPWTFTDSATDFER